MSYYVGVDLGTTYSGTAVSRPGTGMAEAVTLGEKSTVVASAVFGGEDGSFLVGEAAERRALSDPNQVVREFKRRIGDTTPVLVGRKPYAAEELAARFIAHMLRDVSAREGGPPDGVAVTHPAGWGPHKVQSLQSALAGQGVGPILMLTEPQAAAVGYASAERVDPGAVVAVYDLGGGTFDAAVVRKGTGDVGGFELLGRPEGLERLGGVDLDEVVFEHVQQALGAAWDELDPTDPAVLAAVARLRRECTTAKEVLSVDTEVHIPVMLPGTHTSVRLGRAEFEEMIRPAILQTVDAMREAMASAHVTPADLTALLLVGGSSRIPLVAQLVSAGIGTPAAVDVDPKGVIAAGAAVVARDVATRPAPVPVPVPVPVVPPVPGESPVESTMPGATVPLGPAEGEGRAADDAAAWIPTDEAIARPPKVARPFSAGLPPPGRKRVLVLAVATGVLVAGLAGTAVALGATGLGRNNEAGAETPVVTTTAQTPAPAPPPQEQPAQRQAPAPANPPPAQRQRQAPQPPAVVPTTEQPPETTEEPPTTEPTTTNPTTTTTTPPPIDPGDGTGGTEEEGTGSDGGTNASPDTGPDEPNS
jgi:molecular chaperone DnaK